MASVRAPSRDPGRTPRAENATIALQRAYTASRGDRRRFRELSRTVRAHIVSRGLSGYASRDVPLARKMTFAVDDVRMTAPAPPPSYYIFKWLQDARDHMAVQHVAGPWLTEHGRREFSTWMWYDHINDEDVFDNITVQPRIYWSLSSEWQLYELFVRHVNYNTSAYCHGDPASAAVYCSCRRRDVRAIRNLGICSICPRVRCTRSSLRARRSARSRGRWSKSCPRCKFKGRRDGLLELHLASSTSQSATQPRASRHTGQSAS